MTPAALRLAGLLALGALAVAAASCSEPDAEAGADVADLSDLPDAGGTHDVPLTVTPVAYHAVWAEFLSPAEAREQLDLLRAHDLALNLAWPAADLDEGEYWQTVAAFEGSGVQLRPWLLLAYDEGYWPNSTNAPTFAAAARALMDAWEGRGHSPSWLIIDMEPPYERAIALQNQVQVPADELDLDALVEFLRAGIDRDQFEGARGTYAALIADAHARGWKVHMTTLPLVLDDYDDGDDSIRQALNIPVEGLDLDLLSFQLYRPILSDFAGPVTGGEPLTAFVVYDYARSAVERYGGIAAVDLGVVAQGVTESSIYAGAHELVEDLEAAAAAGIGRERVILFSLDGVLDRPPIDRWLPASPQAPEPPPEAPGTAALRAIGKLFDGLEP